jgi:anaerobic dimethyl sulfoxide reductase subunit B
MTYAFHFDAASCTGCKACQAACKDKNNLPVGVLWRRVYEISGGTWIRNQDTWTNTVFAYNFSMSCNHCVHPKCAGVCPVGAYSTRENGIVWLDTSKCIGCGYCAWACPYAAPQYNSHSGTMTKCDFCIDNLDAGLPPACVAACPLRVLNIIDANEEQGAKNGSISLWISPPLEHPCPLPSYSHTEPHLAIKPHPSMSVVEKKVMANQEEVRPVRIPSWEELPLIIFTIFAQLAVGGFWFIPWLFPPLLSLADFSFSRLQFLPSLLIGLSLGVGMVASFTHLGRKRNAWRVLAHLRKSWLSREILFLILFGIGWSATTLAWISAGSLWNHILNVLFLLTSLLGFGLVFSMSQVYRLQSVPVWDTWRTNLSFLIGTALLGLLGMACFLVETPGTGIQVPQFLKRQIAISIFLLLVPNLFIASIYPCWHNTFFFRIGLLFISLIVSIFLSLDPFFLGFWNIFLLFIMVFISEVLGRWLFYKYRGQNHQIGV